MPKRKSSEDAVKQVPTKSPKREESSSVAAPVVSATNRVVAAVADAAMSQIATAAAASAPLAAAAAMTSVAAAAAMSRVSAAFFNQACVDLARSLLGKLIVRQIGSSQLAGRIVETEAYLGGEDKGAHSYKGKTKRNEAMFMDPGTAYVYNIYGMYQCFNISSAGDGAAVLIRAVEPLFGMDLMTTHRQKTTTTKTKTSKTTTTTIEKKTTVKVFKPKELCNGPSKLCQALLINKSFDQHDLRSSEEFFIAEDGFEVVDADIVAKARVGIDYAQEWAKKPLRFYLLNNHFVSVK